MYTFLEIELVFSNCFSFNECSKARFLFGQVFKDGQLSSKKLFYVRKQERIRMQKLKAT